MIYFQFLIKQEKVTLKEERSKLIKDRHDFQNEKDQQLDSLTVEKQTWNDNKQKVDRMYEPEGNIVDLDIGGTHKITTTISTLCTAKDSTLAAMFSGRHKLSMHNGRVFIDREGETFCHVIQYLRIGKTPIFDNKIKENAFFEELDYWQIPLDLNCGSNDDGNG